MGLSASNLISTTLIVANTPSDFFTKLVNFNYQYFNLGLPILLKYRVRKNVRIIGGVYVH